MELNSLGSYPETVLREKELPEGALAQAGKDLLAALTNYVSLALQQQRIDEVRSAAEALKAAEDGSFLKMMAAAVAPSVWEHINLRGGNKEQ